MTPDLRFDFACAARTDRGRVRPRNEDAFLCVPERGLFAVADGMGGHRGGDVASRTAIAALEHGLAGDPQAPDRALYEAVARAQHEIETEAGRRVGLADMGTTLTAVWFPPAGPPLLAHVGDSRLYRLRDGQLALLTRDDTWVQDRLDAGELGPGQARRHPYASMLTRALGVPGRWQPRIETVDVRQGDLLLLCSDGLTGMLDDSALRQRLDAGRPLDDLATDLIAAANDRGGADNITVVLISPTEGAGPGTC
jgi:PPM family protein phosphatase